MASHVPTASGRAKSAETGGKTASDFAIKPVAVDDKFLRVTVTAWRCRAKMVLRITERDAAESVGVRETSSGGSGAGPDKQTEGKASTCKERPQPPLGEGGAIVVVHEEEVKRVQSV